MLNPPISCLAIATARAIACRERARVVVVSLGVSESPNTKPSSFAGRRVHSISPSVLMCSSPPRVEV
jgi:hypothetical protein